MLELVKTKKSQSALKWQGRWLSSSVDAAAEANVWCAQQGLSADDAFPIIVLGVGSGYHLVELAKKYPGRQLVAMDVSQDIINFTRTEHGLVLANVKYICASGVEQLKESPLLRQIMRGAYSLLLYVPATTINSSYYSEVQMFLSGRSEEGLQYLLSCREQLADELGANAIHAATQDPVSIKTLVGRIAKNCSPETKLLFLSLRELVD